MLLRWIHHLCVCWNPVGLYKRAITSISHLSSPCLSTKKQGARIWNFHLTWHHHYFRFKVQLRNFCSPKSRLMMSLRLRWGLASRMVMFKLDFLKDYAKVATVTWFSKRSKLSSLQLLKAKDQWSLLKTGQSLSLCFLWVVMVRSPSQELNTTSELGDSHIIRKG